MRNAGIGKMIIVAAVALALGACAPSKEEPSQLPPGTGPTPSVAPVPQVNTATPPAGRVTAKPQSVEQECAPGGSEASGQAGRDPSADAQACSTSQNPASEAAEEQGESQRAAVPAS